MITIQQVALPSGEVVDHQIDSDETTVIDGRGLTLLPGLIDPHVHFRIPGQGHKEDWQHAARATIQGGYTTVCDMPNNIPACVSLPRLTDKKALIDSQLAEAGIPLRYHLYIGADRYHFDQLVQVKSDVVAIKVFMGSSTGDLLMDDDSSLHAIFALGAAHDLTVALHAENECMIATNEANFTGERDFTAHAKIRNPEVAAKAVEQVIELVRLYGTRAYILHVSSIAELELIAEAKQAGLPIYAETSPHHMFMTEDHLATLGSKAQMNPPLRSQADQDAIFEAVRSGVIDTYGSDHAPHTLAEKDQPYGKAPSGVPGIETNLPLLLTAVHQGKLTLDDVIRLTYTGPRDLMGLAENNDVTLVDLNETRVLEEANLKTKCGWSPYAGWSLTGWPKWVVMKGRAYQL